MVVLWLKFIFCVLLVVSSGYYLSIMADKIAEIRGISKAWIGVVLLASVTSLPELATTLAASRTPNLAVGNIFGSNTINIVIISVIDFLTKGVPILGIVGIGHILNAGFGLFVTGVAMAAIILRSVFDGGISILHVGIESIIILTVYFVGMRLLFTYEKKDGSRSKDKQGKGMSEATSLSKEYMIVLFCSGIVIFSGIWLAHIGDELAQVTGWGRTFVGSIFLAFATSLPEIVVSLSAIRIKSFDMCVGNIFGSNFFNIAILGVLDIFFTQGPILSSVRTDHLFTAILAIMLTSVIIMGIIFRAKKSYYMVNYEIWAVLVCYLMGSYFLFKMAAG